MAEKAPAEREAEKLIVAAGYHEGGEIEACEVTGLTMMLPKPQTSVAKAEGSFGKQDFVYRPEEGGSSLGSLNKFVRRVVEECLRAVKERNLAPHCRILPEVRARRRLLGSLAQRRRIFNQPGPGADARANAGAALHPKSVAKTGNDASQTV
jgi:hypothetical protein